MDMDPDFAQTRSATLMAAALHLLSCSAAHGLTCAKAGALGQTPDDARRARRYRPAAGAQLRGARRGLASAWARNSKRSSARKRPNSAPSSGFALRRPGCTEELDDGIPLTRLAAQRHGR